MEYNTDMVRVGIVSAVSEAKRQVRVHYPDRKLTSGWLYVLQSPPTVTAENCTVKADLVVEAWMPAVGNRVLCLYIPVFGGDGFVIGGI